MAQKAIIGGVAMKELSLFTGAGGGLLGTILLGWRCVGAVEWEDYPCRVLEARQKDGILDEFPIWHMDIREFNRRIAPSYTGLVDVITAGFPCQPFSVAGKQMAADDSRNMWPATIDAIRIVRPAHVFLENVPGIISSGYIVTIIDDLREAGYQVLPPLRLSASDVGANHKRERIWIAALRIGNVAYAEGVGWRDGNAQHIGKAASSSNAPRDGGKVLADAQSLAGWDIPRNAGDGTPGRSRSEPGQGSIDAGQVAYPRQSRLAGRQGKRGNTSEKQPSAKRDGDEVPDAGSKREVERGKPGFCEAAPTCRERADNRSGAAQYVSGQWWQVEPDMGGNAYGMASGLE